MTAPNAISRRDALFELVVNELLAPTLPAVAQALKTSIASGKIADMEGAFKVLDLIRAIYEKDAIDVNKLADLLLKQAKGRVPERPAERSPMAHEAEMDDFFDKIEKDAGNGRTHAAGGDDGVGAGSAGRTEPTRQQDDLAAPR